MKQFETISAYLEKGGKLKPKQNIYVEWTSTHYKIGFHFIKEMDGVPLTTGGTADCVLAFKAYSNVERQISKKCYYIKTDEQ